MRVVPQEEEQGVDTRFGGQLMGLILVRDRNQNGKEVYQELNLVKLMKLRRQ